MSYLLDIATMASEDCLIKQADDMDDLLNSMAEDNAKMKADSARMRADHEERTRQWEANKSNFGESKGFDFEAEKRKIEEMRERHQQYFHAQAASSQARMHGFGTAADEPINVTPKQTFWEHVESMPPIEDGIEDAHINTGGGLRGNTASRMAKRRFWGSPASSRLVGGGLGLAALGLGYAGYNHFKSKYRRVN